MQCAEWSAMCPVPNIRMPGCSNVCNLTFVIWGNLWNPFQIWHRHHGSDGNIYRAIMVSSIMGCLCSLTERIPMPSLIDGVYHRPSFWISIGNIGWTKSTSPSSFVLNVLFLTLPIPYLEWWYPSWWATHIINIRADLSGIWVSPL